MAPREPSRSKHRDRESREAGTGGRSHKKRKAHTSSAKKHASASDESRPGRNSHALSADALAQLNRANVKNAPKSKDEKKHESWRREAARDYDDSHERKAKRPVRDDYHEVPRIEVDKVRKNTKRKKRRVVSGAILEEGRGGQGLRGGAGASSYDSVEKEEIYDYRQKPKRNRKKLWIWAGIGVVVLIIIIAVAVVVSKNKSSDSSNSNTGGLSGVSQGSIPAGAPAWLDPFQWQDTVDFNVTYTAETVGDLPVMGLNSTWDDSKAANPTVPALSTAWGDYASKPARGVNLGGWLSLEPFITPSLFAYDLKMGIIDEWTLCTYLGSNCASTFEKHYSSFVTEETFKEIADAGLDHVRIPYSYWAVAQYPGDAYVFRTSWRYLLRGIEWARKYGLRINLDLHALPGSQNGWNHSGRFGAIAWLNGSDGALNAQRSLDVHDKLSKFFAQDRYKNIISHYGLVNEPKMIFLKANDVINWTEAAYTLVRRNGVKAAVVFGDGFMGLGKWQGQMTGYDGLVLDVHQYVIFNNDQIVFNHTAKVQYACTGWTQQTEDSMNTATGFGPTMVAEWSQADTDCALYLTNVGWGNRWSGNFVTGDASTQALTPRCPTQNSQCECSDANADPSKYSATYKKFLKTFAQAQMTSFEKGWGWFYWTWDTEQSPQWSYKKGLAAGILPAKAYEKDWDCTQPIPSFSDMPEYY